MRSRSLTVALTAVLSLAVAVLAADAGVGGLPWGAVSVSPSAALADMQIVQVSGTAFRPNTPLRIVECGPTATRPYTGGWASAICTTYSVAVTTDADGRFGPVGFVVSTLIEGFRWSHGHNEPASYDCLARNDCHVHVYAYAGGPGSANVDISFGG